MEKSDSSYERKSWTNYIIEYNTCVKFSYMEKSVYDFLQKERLEIL